MEIKEHEKNGHLDAVGYYKAPTKTNITTSIRMDLWNLAKKEKISWSKALEFGIMFLIADRDGVDWPQCNLLDRFGKTIKHRNALALEVDALRQQVGDIDEIEDQDADIEKVLEQKPIVEETE